MRSSQRLAIAMLVALAASCLSCRATNRLDRGDDQTVRHIVICWLKSLGDENARRRLIDESCAFKGRIPGLLDVSAGAPLPSDRPQVESGYDVAIVMTFRDVQALRDYDQHPVHKDAVERVLKPLVAKIVIYDFAEQAKEPPRRRGARN